MIGFTVLINTAGGVADRFRMQARVLRALAREEVEVGLAGHQVTSIKVIDYTSRETLRLLPGGGAAQAGRLDEETETPEALREVVWEAIGVVGTEGILAFLAEYHEEQAQCSDLDDKPKNVLTATYLRMLLDARNKGFEY